MPEDIRLVTTFRTNRKRRRLERILGPEGPLALVDLWLFAAQERSDGDLSGLSADDIEDEVAWTGERGAFVTALASAGWLDGEPGHYRLHNWEDRQPWASAARARSDAGRKAAHARWAAKGACKGGTPYCTDKCPNHGADDATAMRPHTVLDAIAPNRIDSACDGNAPIPTPNPNPTPTPHRIEAAETAKPEPAAAPRGGGSDLSVGGDAPSPAEPESPPERRAGPAPALDPSPAPKPAESQQERQSWGLPSQGLGSLPRGQPLTAGQIEAALSREGWVRGVGQGARALRGLLPLHESAPITAGELSYGISEAKRVRAYSPLAYIASRIGSLRSQSAPAQGTPSVAPPRPVMSEADKLKANTELWARAFRRAGYPPHPAKAVEKAATGAPGAEDHDLLRQGNGSWDRYEEIVSGVKAEFSQAMERLHLSLSLN